MSQDFSNRLGRRKTWRRNRKRNPWHRRSFRRLLMEGLEDRNLLATFVVSSMADAGAGTLREAIDLANANGTADLIKFSTSGSISLQAALPPITEKLEIDGYLDSPGGASANSNGPGQGFNAALAIVLDGAGAPDASGLTIIANETEIRGLVIQSFIGPGIEVFSDSNIIEGNFIGTNAVGDTAAGNGGPAILITGDNNTIGSTSGLGNLVSGGLGSAIEIVDTADGNNIVGNLIGLDAAGTAALKNALTGINISGGDNNTIGGTTEEARNVISGGDEKGIAISDGTASGNKVQGNYIGTDVTGMNDVGNAQHGIDVFQAVNTQILDNVISGNDQFGVFLNATPGATIQGNLIGTDKDGTGNVGNTDSGIFLAVDVENTMIGGLGVGEGNTIAFNGVGGLVLSNLAKTGNSVLSNSFFDNTGIGIDIDQSGGLTANDPGDSDGGANLTQNFPEISRAEIVANGDLVVDYVVDTAAGNATYPLTVQFFEADSSASGEGKTGLSLSDTYTAAQTPRTNLNLGNAGALGVSAGDPIVALAIDANGNTSEFSVPFAVTMAAANTAPTLTLDADASSGAAANNFQTTFFAVTGTPVTIADSDAVVADPDAGAAIAGVTIAVSGLLDGGDEVLTVGGIPFSLSNGAGGQATVDGTLFNITVTATGANSVDVVLLPDSGTTTLTSTEILLNSSTYDNLAVTPTVGNRTLQVQVSDGQATNNVSNFATSTIAVSNIELDLDANNSTALGTAFSVTFTEGDPLATPAVPDSGPVPVVDSDVDINTVGNINVDGATISLPARPDGSSEGLNLTAAALPPGVTIVNANSGPDAVNLPQIFLTGLATTIDYETALRQIEYDNTLQDPTPGVRNVEITADAAGSTSNVAVAAITVVATNDNPVAFEFTGIDRFNTFGNVTLHAGGAVSFDLAATNDLRRLLNGATDVDSATITIRIGTNATTLGGTVVVNADGSFVYRPPVGSTDVVD